MFEHVSRKVRDRARPLLGVPPFPSFKSSKTPKTFKVVTSSPLEASGAVSFFKRASRKVCNRAIILFDRPPFTFGESPVRLSWEQRRDLKSCRITSPRPSPHRSAAMPAKSCFRRGHQLRDPWRSVTFEKRSVAYCLVSGRPHKRRAVDGAECRHLPKRTARARKSTEYASDVGEQAAIEANIAILSSNGQSDITDRSYATQSHDRTVRRNLITAQANRQRLRRQSHKNLNFLASVCKDGSRSGARAHATMIELFVAGRV